ncbi:MAG: hypothetical protein U0T83_08865 [Bacteriovoracaceae bacterium]
MKKVFFKSSFILFLVLSISTTSQAQKPVNETMVKLAAEIQGLFPYMFQPELLKETKNKKLVEEKIALLNGLFKSAAPHFKKNSPISQVSLNIMLGHLEDTHKIFSRNDNEFASKALKAIPAICASCHTQDHKVAKVLYSDIEKDLFKNDYEYAEFSFITHNYFKALEHYNLFLKNSDSSTNKFAIANALEKKLIIGIIYTKDNKASIESFKNDLINNNIPSSLKNNINEWIVALNKDHANSELNRTSYTFKEIEKLILKYLISSNVEENRVNIIKVNDILKQFSNNNKDPKLEPAVLYYLAIADRLLSNNFFFSSADLFLKACILGYSNTPYAKKCFKEYKDNLILSYTGSSGENLPSEVENELKELEAKVYPKKKK